MMAIGWMAVIGNGAVRVTYPAIGQVGVIMVVFVHGQAGCGPVAKQAAVFRVGGNRAGRTLAADMAIQTNHLVGSGHDHVQVVRDQQHATAGLIAHRLD